MPCTVRASIVTGPTVPNRGLSAFACPFSPAPRAIFFFASAKYTLELFALFEEQKRAEFGDLERLNGRRQVRSLPEHRILRSKMGARCIRRSALRYASHRLRLRPSGSRLSSPISPVARTCVPPHKFDREDAPALCRHGGSLSHGNVPDFLAIFLAKQRHGACRDSIVNRP